MNTIFTDLITYSADKQYKFTIGRKNDLYIESILPKDGNIELYIVITARGNAHVSIHFEGYDNERDYLVIVDSSKVNTAEKLYRLIESRMIKYETAINEKIRVLQDSYDYYIKGMDSNKFIENIKGIDMNYTSNKIKGYFNNYTCTFESEKDSQLARLTFNTNKEKIAKIMKCLIDNGLLEPVK